MSVRDSTLINRGKENSKKYFLLEKCLLFKGRMTQIPLRVFGQNDFPLGGGRGYPPIPLKNSIFCLFHAFLALFGPLNGLFGPFLTLSNKKIHHF